MHNAKVYIFRILFTCIKTCKLTDCRTIEWAHNGWLDRARCSRALIAAYPIGIQKEPAGNRATLSCSAVWIGELSGNRISMEEAANCAPWKLNNPLRIEAPCQESVIECNSGSGRLSLLGRIKFIVSQRLGHINHGTEHRERARTLRQIFNGISSRQ